MASNLKARLSSLCLSPARLALASATVSVGLLGGETVQAQPAASPPAVAPEPPKASRGEPAAGSWTSPPPGAPGKPGPRPPADAAAPGASPGPYTYSEPWSPPADGSAPPPPSAAQPQQPLASRPAPAYPPGSGERMPPAYGYLPVYEAPPPPPPPRTRAPRTSLWLGARGGVLFPGGRLYDLGYSDPGRGANWAESNRSWADESGPGPLLELDMGGRFGRHYILYAYWERAWLTSGGDPLYEDIRGKLETARTDVAGGGFRWSSNPDEVGVVLDLGLGYRWFKQTWEAGHRYSMGGFGDFRFGIGADLRVSSGISLSPMVHFSQGVFTTRNFAEPNEPLSRISSSSAPHNTITLSVGGHFDLVGRED